MKTDRWADRLDWGGGCMTNIQIRSAILGALSASMMPMEREAECVRFLDRCLAQMVWSPVDQLPKLHTEVYLDDKETFDYEVSDPVLAFTADRQMVTVKCCLDDCGKPWWFDDNGSSYKVTYWRPLPDEPKGEKNADLYPYCWRRLHRMGNEFRLPSLV